MTCTLFLQPDAIFFSKSSFRLKLDCLIDLQSNCSDQPWKISSPRCGFFWHAHASGNSSARPSLRQQRRLTVYLTKTRHVYKHCCCLRQYDLHLSLTCSNSRFRTVACYKWGGSQPIEPYEHAGLSSHNINFRNNIMVHRVRKVRT